MKMPCFMNSSINLIRWGCFKKNSRKIVKASLLLRNVDFNWISSDEIQVWQEGCDAK